MSHASEASVAAGVVLFWFSLVLYVVLLRARGLRMAREAERGSP